MIQKKISILIIGSKKKYSLERFYKKAFNAIGVKKIYLCSNDIYFYLYCLFSIMRVKFLYNLIWPAYESRINSFLRKIKSIDLIIIFKGIEINKDFLLNLKKRYPATKIINIYTDDPFNFSSVSTSSHLLLDSIPLYDFFFIWSKNIKKKLKKKYKYHKIFYYLPFGYDKRARSIIKKKIDINFISFIASGDKYRESIIKKISSIKINIFGNSWSSNLPNHLVNTFVHGKNLIDIIAKSYASINILRKQNLTSHNMKTFEIPAMGGLLVTTRSKEQNFFFPENKASVMFNSARELEKKIFFLRKNRKIAENIRQKGFELSSQHSYTNRAKHLMKIIYNDKKFL
jgi:spore maturation protein CgeB